MIKKFPTNFGYYLDVKVGGESLGGKAVNNSASYDAIFENVKIISQKRFSEFENDFPTIELRNADFKHKPYWAEWSEYGPCSEDCGSGQKVRERVCVVNEGTAENKISKIKIPKVCNTRPCPIPDPAACTCPDGEFSCTSRDCGRNELCNLQNWLGEAVLGKLMSIHS